MTLGDFFGFLGNVIDNTLATFFEILLVIAWQVDWWNTSLLSVLYACGYYLYVLWFVGIKFQDAKVEIEVRSIFGKGFLSIIGRTVLETLGAITIKVLWPTVLFSFIVGFFR